MHDPIVFTIFLIFTGAAIVATLALYARQAMLVAYILIGVVFGPHVTGLVNDPELIGNISQIGIIFLLFLLGLDLPFGKLVQLVGETTLVTGISSLLFGAMGMGLGYMLGYTLDEQLVIGASLMFSSTIIGLKLLPTTVLHHKRTGEVIISILLLQDLIAILALLMIQIRGGSEMGEGEILLLTLSLPLLFLAAYVLERFVIVRLIQRFDTIQEYIFLLAIGWCMGFAELAGALGLSHEIGAFIAGIALATSPVAQFISESLKPLRDFFLIIFFFSLGAAFDPGVLDRVLLPALVLAAISMLIKPPVYGHLLKYFGEKPQRAWEIGARLGQISEFSLLIAVLAYDLKVIGSEVSYLIQTAGVITFVVSSYFIVAKYPTPISVSDRLRQN